MTRGHLSVHRGEWTNVRLSFPLVAVDTDLQAMVQSRRRHAFAEDSDLAFPASRRRRDSDWGGEPRIDQEDAAWAARRAAVSMAAAAIHACDGGTGTHSDDVVHLCDAIADQLGVYGDERAELLAAAELHDVGKVGIPNEVLDKPGPLDDREWSLIREHTVAGQRIVESVPELQDVARLVRHSHERWDGGGYPDGLSGEQIPLGSRIVFCADAFHAIRSDRPYRRGRTARAALAEVRRNADSQFDPVVAEALERSAGQMRETVRAGSRGLATTVRSRRLAALLLTLALGGSALAAGGSHFLRGGSDADARPASGPSSGAPDAGAGKEARRRKPAATPERAKRGDAGSAAAAERTPGPHPQAGSSAADRRRAATAPATVTTGTPPAVPRRPRLGRAATPGRSGEAPRRPAQPGKPVGGAPGRSEEAPGRPSWPVTPPRKPVTAERGPVTMPGARPPGDAKHR